MVGDTVAIDVNIMHEKSCFGLCRIHENLKIFLIFCFQKTVKQWKMENMINWFWNDAHWITELLRRYLLHKCLKFRYYINTKLHGLKKRINTIDWYVNCFVIYRNLHSCFSLCWRYSHNDITIALCTSGGHENHAMICIMHGSRGSGFRSPFQW